MKEGLDTAIITLLREGRSVTVKASGRSMHPFLRPGDLVAIRPFPSPDSGGVRAGDLILFEQGRGRWCLHRAIQTAREASSPVLAKGDSLLRPDPPVDQPRIAGKAFSIRRPEGRERSLGTAFSRPANALIALLSRWEALCFNRLPSGVRRNNLFLRLIKAPKWFVSKMFYP